MATLAPDAPIENLPPSFDSRTQSTSLPDGLRPPADDSLRPSVDPDAAEELLADVRLGHRIKRLRLKRSMGLVELGKQTGLSASFLSQLETGRVVPTLRNLARLALVFGKDLSYFFDGGESTIFRIQRGKDRVRLAMGAPDPDYFAESFGILVPEGGLRPCLAEFVPGDNRDPFYPELYPGIEMALVLSGELTLRRNSETHVLHPRDVAYISGETERNYHCSGSTPCTALIISFDADTGEPRRVKARTLPAQS